MPRPGRARRNGRGGGKTAPSHHDELQAEATRAAAKAIARHLEGCIERNSNRMIRTLTMFDLDFLAIAAISAWVLARADQAIVVKCDVEKAIRDVPVMP